MKKVLESLINKNCIIYLIISNCKPINCTVKEVNDGYVKITQTKEVEVYWRGYPSKEKVSCESFISIASIARVYEIPVNHDKKPVYFD